MSGDRQSWRRERVRRRRLWRRRGAWGRRPPLAATVLIITAVLVHVYVGRVEVGGERGMLAHPRDPRGEYAGLPGALTPGGGGRRPGPQRGGGVLLGAPRGVSTRPRPTVRTRLNLSLPVRLFQDTYPRPWMPAMPGSRGRRKPSLT